MQFPLLAVRTHTAETCWASCQPAPPCCFLQGYSPTTPLLPGMTPFQMQNPALLDWTVDGTYNPGNAKWRSENRPLAFAQFLNWEESGLVISAGQLWPNPLLPDILICYLEEWDSGSSPSLAGVGGASTCLNVILGFLQPVSTCSNMLFFALLEPDAKYEFWKAARQHVGNTAILDIILLKL